MKNSSKTSNFWNNSARTYLRIWMLKLIMAFHPKSNLVELPQIIISQLRIRKTLIKIEIWLRNALSKISNKLNILILREIVYNLEIPIQIAIKIAILILSRLIHHHQEVEIITKNMSFCCWPHHPKELTVYIIAAWIHHLG